MAIKRKELSLDVRKFNLKVGSRLQTKYLESNNRQSIGKHIRCQNIMIGQLIVFQSNGYAGAGKVEFLKIFCFNSLIDRSKTRWIKQ